MINECGCGCGGAVGGCMKESPKELESYTFFGNLQTIKRAVDAMLEMDPQQVDAILQDGHNWAADHLATSKDDIEEVAGFMMNRMEQEEPHEKEMVPFVHTFESFVNENFKKHYGDAVSVEDFKSINIGDQVLYRGKRWNVIEANEYVLRLEDESGRKKTVNRNQFKEYGAITEAKKPTKKKVKKDQDGDTDFADAKQAGFPKRRR